MRNPFEEKRKNERIARLVKERDEAVNELKQVREELSIQTRMSGMLERVVGDLERKLKAAQGRNEELSSFLVQQKEHLNYLLKPRNHE